MNTLLLLKFGERNHIKSLHEEGDIYMNFMSNHKKSDENIERFDKFEGAITNEYIKEGVLQIKQNDDEEWKSLKVFNSHFNNFVDASKFYSYCLFSITKEDVKTSGLYKIDSRMQAFGDTMLMIRNHVTFINKIQEYLDFNQYEYQIGFVKYYNNKENINDLTLHHKIDLLKHQKEFRIIVKAKSDRPLQFNIGSLTAHAEIYESRIIETMTMRP